MSSRTHGRHRAPGRLNPAVTLSAAAVRTAGPAMQASAVIAASGGMLASLTMPAEAVALPESPEAVATLAADGSAAQAAATTGATAPLTGAAKPVGSAFGPTATTQRVTADAVAERTAGTLRSAARSAQVIAAAAIATPARDSWSVTMRSVGSSAAVSSGVMSKTTNTVKPAIMTMAKATSVTATPGRTVAVEGSTAATGSHGAAVQTVESSQRSAVIPSERVAKLLDRRMVRSRSERAGAELNMAFPEVTRRNLGTARRLTTARVIKTAQGAGALGIASGLSGIWYRWGGTTPSGFDCSGFTSYVYRKMGTRLPRTAAAQQAYTKRVKTPRPGDLVFFGSPAHHVGIYAGSGMMYDAPRRGKKTGLRKIYTSRVSFGRIG